MAPTTERSAARTLFVLVDRPPNRPTPAIRGEERVLGIANGTQPSTTHGFTTHGFTTHGFTTHGFTTHGFTTPTRTPAMGRSTKQGVS